MNDNLIQKNYFKGFAKKFHNKMDNINSINLKKYVTEHSDKYILMRRTQKWGFKKNYIQGVFSTKNNLITEICNIINAFPENSIFEYTHHVICEDDKPSYIECNCNCYYIVTALST